MPDKIRYRARKLFKAPFKFVSGYIWDADGEMLADNHVGFEAPDATLRVRGWGRLAYIAKSPKEAGELQDAYGELIAEALTAHFGRLSATLVPSDKLAKIKAERDRYRAALDQIGDTCEDEDVAGIVARVVVPR